MNHEWTVANVGHISPDKNIALTQSFTFDDNYKLLTNKFVLKFDYAAKVGSDLSTIKGSCVWNDKVHDLEVNDKKIHSFVQNV